MYGNSEVFDLYRGAFYSLYSDCVDDSNALEAVVDFIRSDEISFPGRKAFRQSGATELLKAVLAAHDDLYSRDEDGVLNDIYLIMCDNAPSQPDVMVEHYFSRLRDFMSESTYSDICRGVGDGEECYDTKAVSAWAYSFWARRHHDGVDGLAYQILKIVDGYYN